jgi:hypothetical protein
VLERWNNGFCRVTSFVVYLAENSNFGEDDASDAQGIFTVDLLWLFSAFGASRVRPNQA